DFWMRLSKVARYNFLPKTLGESQLVERAASRRSEYHHGNLEALLRDHFRDAFGDSPSLGARLKMRRRLGLVYRSALGQLMQYRESPELQRRYVGKMLAACPWDPKNVARAMLWALGKGR
ncbi:MAG: hypothetical protein HY925_12470, partial [Elusimicrobia bacterium]|nr:hypothetical protein [Elusimicrobiota bacterium]